MTGDRYVAATRDAGVLRRPDRVVVRMHGRDPLGMVQGLITNDLAGAPEGRAVYAALLTPKGRMIADLRALTWGDDVLLEVDRGALDGLTATLKKMVPPLFARFEVTEQWQVMSLVGPRSREVAVAVAGDAPAEDAQEEAFVASEDGALVLRTYNGYDVIAGAERIDGWFEAAVAGGARAIDAATLEVVRIEAGRPRWGAELTEAVIPLEAGLRERAISETKGCYTGQEVIIRILHRGHVNRHLRGLKLGELAPPEQGTELFRAEDGRAMGLVTSACVSPAFGETIGLGYVRREIEPPGPVRLGAPDGPEIEVVALPFA